MESRGQPAAVPSQMMEEGLPLSHNSATNSQFNSTMLSFQSGISYAVTDSSRESGYRSMSSTDCSGGNLISPMNGLYIGQSPAVQDHVSYSHYLESISDDSAGLSPIAEGASMTSRVVADLETPLCPSMHSSPLLVPCLAGREHVDFLTELGTKRVLPFVVATILNFLEAKDLNNVVRVCHSWRELGKKDTRAWERLSIWLEERWAIKENLHQSRPDGKIFQRGYSEYHPRHVRISRRSLGELQNRNTPEPSPSILTRRSNSLKDLFDEAARNLPDGGHLCKCPSCNSPCQVLPGDVRIRCSKVLCALEFCPRCRRSHQCGTPCRDVSGGVTPPSGVVGSHISRRNLRRLL